jgi:hypothetical protein
MHSNEEKAGRGRRTRLCTDGQEPVADVCSAGRRKRFAAQVRVHVVNAIGTMAPGRRVGIFGPLVVCAVKGGVARMPATRQLYWQWHARQVITGRSYGRTLKMAGPWGDLPARLRGDKGQISQ